MTVVELLIEARKLIVSPEHWTQNVLARDESGRSSTCTSDNAVRWCSLGALGKVLGADFDYKREDLCDCAIAELDKAAHPWRIYEFNDISHHTSVLRVWGRAIKAARDAEASATAPDQ